jgi:predicted RNase H-like nuclease (RuvC/YqgF family)
VEESRPISASYVLTNLDARQVDLFVQQKTIDKPVEDALRAVLAQKQVVETLGDRSSHNDDETQQIFDDQQRLRENMKALKGSPEEKALLQRYTQQLNEEENRLEALRRENTQIEAEKTKQQEALNKMIQDLSFDVRL